MKRSTRKLENKYLHIVSFDVPYPADYGGVIDVYYRVKALKELGVKVILHCFEYGRGEQQALSEITEKVYYYQRKKSISDWFSSLPFIVKTRSTEELINNLLKDRHPVLFEGLHTTYYLKDHRLKDRVKLVRTHNIEHEYYNDLSNYASGMRKIYFKSEAKKLRRYEAVLKSADHILAIKESDKKHFERFGKTTVLPASIPTFHSEPHHTTKPYCLFHGNLSVQENSRGAFWLINNVFGHEGLKDALIVAGKNPPSELQSVCSNRNIQLISNPKDKQLEKLIHDARVHVFYSEQETGIKLKLLHVLASSGHLLVNPEMISGSDLKEVCTVAHSPDEFTDNLKQMLKIELTDTQFQSRLDFIERHYNNINNCRLILLPLI